jgi:predicted dithiol-disulfide oxidoreductase (DUF899 family)
MPVTFPGESPQYRSARDRLLADEIELRRRIEAVAAARRALPQGGAVPEDYVFDSAGPGGSPARVTLSALFSPGKDTLAVYHMMFPRDPSDQRPGAASGETAKLPLAAAPCPSCTALLDQLDGAVEHVAPHLDFVVVAKAPIDQLLTFAKERGWRRLRFLSCAASRFNRDYHGQTTSGEQRPMMNVFSRADGTIRHFWGSEMLYAPADPGQDPRHVGLLEPSWNMFDLTRAGRKQDWDEQLQYDTACRCEKP